MKSMMQMMKFDYNDNDNYGVFEELLQREIMHLVFFKLSMGFVTVCAIIKSVFVGHLLELSRAILIIC
jgi:hypothetical protein